MKKAIIGTLTALMLMSCAQKNDDSGYIGPQDAKVENGVMTPETLLALGRLSDPQLSPDGSKILYGVSYTSVAENRSCRNLFVCNPDGSGKVQLTRYAKSVNAARWSNDGKFIFFLQGGQLWKAPYMGGKLGKKEQLSNVESGIQDYKLSPDQNSIYYITATPGPVKGPQDAYADLDKAQAYVAEDLMYRHWDHWVTETPRTYLASLQNGTVTLANSIDIIAGEDPNIELPTEPFGGAEQLDWSPCGRYIAYSCRKLTGKQYAFSTNSGIYVYDTVTGATLTIAGKGGYDTDPVWSPDGSHLAWISMERDGYEADKQRLMVADITYSQEADGQSFGMQASNIRDLTASFIYDANAPFWTPDGKTLIFASTMDAVTALCSADVDTASVKRLTPADWWLGFDAPFAYSQEGGRTTLLASYMSMEFPTELVKVEIESDGTASYTAITHENDDILASIEGIRQESITLKSANGEDLHVWVLYPPHFNENGTYPAVEMFNGGPQTSLDQAWSYRWNFRLMAQQGYVVILPNRHGDSGFGQEWKEQISGDYAGLNMQDYIIAGRWAKDQKWCSKIGGVGASYGGYSVYMMEGLHGDLFDCFISHAGIFNEKDLWYTTEEMWFANWDNGGMMEYAYEPGKIGPAGDGITFGGLQQASAPYSTTAKALHHYANDPSSMATKWHTPILCIHGMMDFRIPYTQGMAAFNTAQMMGVPSKLLIFPEENHWILQPQNSLFWHREFYGWLEKWLK